MNDDEYRRLLGDLFEHYVRPRLPRVRRRFHHHMMEEWSYHLAEVQRASYVWRYIDAHCDSDSDAFDTFTPTRLARAVSETRQGVEFSARVAREAGFLDALDAHSESIYAGLKAEHLPEMDADVLAGTGSSSPLSDIRVLVDRARGMRESLRRHPQEVSLEDQLRMVVERLEREEKVFDTARQESSGPDKAVRVKRTRRWFKGLGQIGQGAALSIANVALAVGALDLPVSPETKTWGSIASVATGVGTILSGIGDLRNE